MPANDRFGTSRSVLVFCGSATGTDYRLADAAMAMGVALARRKWTLVYGGAHHGLMGIMADAALFHHGRVIGVIPDALMEREVAHTGLTELHVVPSMHARKALMADLSDAVAILPGGLGTLDEMFEMWTWSVLGLHERPMALLNAGGYFDPLLAMLERMVTGGFVRAPDMERVSVHGSVEELLGALAG